ncbi:hypothetical protein ACFOMD_14030 [Sphingoaurantiacus capsulatus]|uniref:EF-hand domain-containing protein n=1 Tax=Sphingoaurantiacus capsulatus TaxID=1771310 RepID=A0ABV7XF37_9SPHN
MRKLIIALALGGALSLPAIANDWTEQAETLADDGFALAGSDEWGEEPRLAAPDRFGQFRYDGSGWAELDGWMRGDPTLRHWVLFRFDLDADGQLTADEAAMARRGFYELADANRSDRITSEEFVSGWMAVRQELQGFYGDAIIRPA